MFRRTLIAIACISHAGAAIAQSDPRNEVGTLGRSDGSVNGEFEDHSGDTMSEGLADAAHLYAEEHGIGLDDAAKRLIRQIELSDRMAELEEKFPEYVAGSWIEHRPELRGVIRLTESAKEDDSLRRALEENDLPIEVADSTGPAVEELARKLDEAMPRLQSLGSEFQGAEVDVRTGEIVLLFGPGETGEKLDADTLNRARDVAEELMGAPVRIETFDAPADDGHTRGGADLSSCTSGFVVRHPLTGTRGYITAGHCGNNQTYFEFGGVSYSTTFIGEIRDANQDVQWHTTPHIEQPRFYASSTISHRPLQGRRTRSEQSVGGYTCHRGKTTGYSCGYIQSKTYAPGYANACPGTTCASVWIRVSGSSLKCFPGDSGGPWFIAYRAYGIYKGQSSSGTTASGCNWAFYMASNYFGIDLVYD